MQTVQYTPGVCNIGPQERIQRLVAGWIGTAAFVGLLIYFRMGGFAKTANFYLMIPALVGFVGFLQDHFHFCVNLGLRGLRNMDKKAFDTERVEQEEYRRLDRQRAWKIIGMGVGLSLAATLAAYFL